MQRIFLFEGADETGKTAVAQELSRVLGIPYFKNSLEHAAYKKNELRLVTKYAGPFMLDFLKQTGTSAIFDRSYPSEYAYARTFGREYDPDIITILDEGYAALNAVIVFCYKTGQYTYQDELIEFSRVGRINREFRELLDMSKCEHIELNTTSQDLDYQIGSILTFVDHLQKAS